MQDHTGKYVRTVSAATYEYLETLMPRVMECPQLRSLFWGLWGARPEPAQGPNVVMANAKWIAFRVDEYKAWETKHFVAKQWLDQLAEALPKGEEWALEYTGWSYKRNQARHVRLKTPSQIKNIILEDAMLYEKPRVFLVSGERKTPTADALVYTRLAGLLTHSMSQPKCPTQAMVLKYLNELPLDLFGIKAAEQLAALRLAAERHQAVVYNLTNVLDQEKPFYHPVDGCYRVFSSGTQFLPGNIRKALYPHWLEVDLRNAHAAIIASTLDLAKTKAMLASGQSIWNYLFEALPEFLSDAHAATLPSLEITKPALKTFIYSICFGAAKNTLKENIKSDLNALGMPARACTGFWKALCKIDVVSELMDGCEAWRNSLRESKTHIDPFGIEQIVRNDAEARAAAFNWCSAVELKLMAPLYEFAIANPSLLTITLHQHDGCSVITHGRKDKRDKILAQAKAAVDLKASELGVPTTLEWKP